MILLLAITNRIKMGVASGKKQIIYG